MQRPEPAPAPSTDDPEGRLSSPSNGRLSNRHLLSAAGTGVSAAAGDARSQMETEYEGRLSSNAQRILDQVVGPGRAVVSVRADLDLSQRQSKSETHSYTNGTPPVSESTTTEKYDGSGAPVGGVLGPENMPDAASNAGGGNSTYQKESTTANNSVDTTTETVQSAPGAINRLTVSVVMDDAVASSLVDERPVGHVPASRVSDLEPFRPLSKPFGVLLEERRGHEVPAGGHADLSSIVE